MFTNVDVIESAHATMQSLLPVLLSRNLKVTSGNQGGVENIKDGMMCSKYLAIIVEGVDLKIFFKLNFYHFHSMTFKLIIIKYM